MVGLLSHDNIDVSGSVLALIGSGWLVLWRAQPSDNRCAAELLEGTDSEAEAAYVAALAGEFAEAGLLAAMVANWERLRQQGEGSGPVVAATLSVFEHMIEHDEETCDALAATPRFAQLCVDTMSPRAGGGGEAAGDLELLASEVLAMALQGATPEEEDEEQDTTTRDARGDLQLMESLLVLIHSKGRKDAQTPSDIEVVNNAADAVAALVLYSPARHRATFDQCEGVQLMCKLLKSEGFGMLSAVRVLSFAVQDQASSSVLVEADALKYLFRWWLKDEWPKKLAVRHSWGPEEWRALREHLTALLSALCVHLAVGSVNQLRLWKKFDDEAAAVPQVAAQWAEHRAHLMRKGLMVPPRNAAPADDEQPEDEDEEDPELVAERLAEGHVSLTQLTLVLVALAALPSPLQPSLSAKVGAACKSAGVRFAEALAVVCDHRQRTGEDWIAALESVRDDFLS